MARSGSEVREEITSLPIAGKVPTTDLAINQSFTEFHNRPEGIRAPHAFDALRNAYDSARYDLDEGGPYVSIAVAHVNIAKPYTMLVYLTEQAGKPPMLHGAWRLYEIESSTPSAAAFGLLIERTGEPFRIGTLEGLFFAKLTTEPGPASELHFQKQSGSIQFAGLIRRRTSGETDWSWAFAMDPDRYHTDIKRYR